MNKLFVAVACLLQLSCGMEPSSKPDRNPIVNVGDFKHYVQLFQEQATKLGQNIVIKDLIIKYKHIPQTKEGETILGRCFYSSDTTPLIEVDQGNWTNLSMLSRQLLMFHELGHCILRRDHVEEHSSIMNPYLISGEKFMENEKILIAELFDRSTYGSLGLIGDEYDSDNSGGCHNLYSGIPNRMGNEIGHQK